MRKDREEATTLRQSGMSYSEIRKRMDVPKSTLSSWFRDQNWTGDLASESIRRARYASAIRMTVLNTVRGNRLRKVYEDARQDAITDFHELKYHPLFISGMMFYWCHGDKTSRSRVSVSSSDQNIIRIFSLFLKKICSYQAFRVQLVLKHDFNREEQTKQFWSENCGFRPENFIKTVHLRSAGQNKLGNKAYYGVCNIIVNSAYLKNKILKWMELFSDEIGNEKYATDDHIERRV